MFQLALEIIKQNENNIVRSREEGETMVTLSQYTQRIYEGNEDIGDKVSRLPTVLLGCLGLYWEASRQFL